MQGTLRDYLHARRMLAGGRFTRLVSTGASVAVSFFAPAVAAGVPCTYIESATRTDGPSLTGRLLTLLPGVRLYTQYPSWAEGRWRYGGSVFDAYTAHRSPSPPAVRRVVVALGTHPRYAFPRLLDRLVRILPPSAEVLWQVGRSGSGTMPPGATRQMPFDALQQAMREADVVITHAGVGSALTALAAGRCPIYVPRRRQFAEHVDDHQVQIARELHTRGLVLAREADAITGDDLLAAAAVSVSHTAGIRPGLATADFG